MGRLTAIVLRHKGIVVLAWVAITLVGFVSLGHTTKRLNGDFSVPGDPAAVADARIAALYHNGGSQPPTVLTLTPPGGRVTNPAVAAKVGGAFAAAARAVPNSRVADAATTGDAHFATADGRTALALLYTPAPGQGQPDITPTVTAALSSAAPSGWHTGITGFAQLATGGSTKGNSARTEVLLGAVGALGVLAFVFASFLAFLPLIMALVAVPTTFLFVLGLTYLTPVSSIVEFLIALIGLGVSIDYSLLVVTRWREARASGAANHAAVAEAMEHAGRAVVFSGLTVGVSLLALIVLPVPFLRNVGAAGFFIPIVSVAVATTLLPVLLATVGPRLDWPHLRRETHASRPWTAWARLVTRHSKAAALAGTAIVVALIIPVTSLRMGEPPAKSLAQGGPAHAALVELNDRGVPSGLVAPMEVLARPDSAQAIVARLDRVPGVETAFSPATHSYRQGGTALIDVLPTGEPSTPPGAATVTAVRAAAAHTPGVLGVGGAGPTQADFIRALYGNFPFMLGLIALVTLILLTRVFRSVVLAAKAVIFNMASVGAAYGVMVLVWQMGYGSKAIWGAPAAGSVSVWVPIMVFAFLFGLSMDYEVFILTRMREAYDSTGSTSQAIEVGIGRTGRLVTGAALILFLSLLSLSTAPITDLRVLATGLGAGILLDALVVRCLLVPALVGVLGRWNWWLPAWGAKALGVTPSHPQP